MRQVLGPALALILLATGLCPMLMATPMTSGRAMTGMGSCGMATPRPASPPTERPCCLAARHAAVVSAVAAAPSLLALFLPAAPFQPSGALAAGARQSAPSPPPRPPSILRI